MLTVRRRPITIVLWHMPRIRGHAAFSWEGKYRRGLAARHGLADSYGSAGAPRVALQNRPMAALPRLARAVVNTTCTTCFAMLRQVSPLLEEVRYRLKYKSFAAINVP